MKTRILRLLVILSSMLAFVATLNVSTACIDYVYQPKVPKCLRKN